MGWLSDGSDAADFEQAMSVELGVRICFSGLRIEGEGVSAFGRGLEAAENTENVLAKFFAPEIFAASILTGQCSIWAWAE